MKKLFFISAVTVLIFSACTKKADVQDDWYNGVRSKADVAAELNKNEYPYNQLNDAAKKEIIEAISFDENSRMNGSYKSINTATEQIGLRGVQALFSNLAEAELLLIDRDGNLLVKSANKSESGGITTSNPSSIGTITMHVCPTRGCQPYCHDDYCVNLISNTSNGTN